jgi:hypothetical protein
MLSTDLSENQAIESIKAAFRCRMAKDQPPKTMILQQETRKGVFADVCHMMALAILAAHRFTVKMINMWV